MGAGELAKKVQGTWYLYYPRGSTLYRLIHGGGGGSGGDVGGGYLGPLREGRGEVSETYSKYILKVLDLTCKTQSRLHAEIAHASIAVVSLPVFIVFACVYEYCSCAFACMYVRAIVRMCMRSYVRELHLKCIK